MKKLHLICNAHLDPVWLWDWEEGAAAALATFRSAVALAGEYDFIGRLVSAAGLQYALRGILCPPDPGGPPVFPGKIRLGADHGRQCGSLWVQRGAGADFTENRVRQLSHLQAGEGGDGRAGACGSRSAVKMQEFCA